MYFCPLCESLLIFQSSSNHNNFKCWHCPYYFNIQKKIKNEIKFNEKRKFNEIFTTSNKNMSKMEINCQKCENNEAYFFQMQTRSMDEASTIFYKCTKCEFTWKDN